jgi:hypothetical protein
MIRVKILFFPSPSIMIILFAIFIKSFFIILLFNSNKTPDCSNFFHFRIIFNLVNFQALAFLIMISLNEILIMNFIVKFSSIFSLNLDFFSITMRISFIFIE